MRTEMSSSVVSPRRQSECKKLDALSRRIRGRWNVPPAADQVLAGMVRLP